jgi:putative transposase
MKAYKFKLYQSKRNGYLVGLILIAAQIWNHSITLHKRYYRLYGKHLNVYKLKKHITKLKKLPKHKHWNQLGSQAVQDVVLRINKSYNLFFSNLKSRKANKTANSPTIGNCRQVRPKRFVSPPNFKKSRKYKSFTLTQAGYEFLGGNRVRIGKKIFKFFKSRHIEGNPKTVTIKRDSLGDLWLIVTTDHSEASPEINARDGNSIGFDFGLKTFLIGSDGTQHESPLFFKRGGQKIRKASQQLSRKRKGSRNRYKANLHLGRVHRKVANQRNDFHWKLANQITDKYDLICFEDLNLSAMQRLWGRKITDLGFYSFLHKVEYLANEKGKRVRLIDKWFPSSKMCHRCGCLNESLTLGDRYWTCDSCHTTHDRDLNAAINIHAVGVAQPLTELP